jgi:hypothetical protein
MCSTSVGVKQSPSWQSFADHSRPYWSCGLKQNLSEGHDHA